DGLDLYLTQLTRCGAPEGYFALTDQTFANQAAFFKTAQDAGKAAQEAAFSQPPEKRGLAIANLAGMTDFFAARGISKEQAAACLADTAKATTLANASTEQGEKYKIEGTPTFIINGAKLDANTWPLVKAELEKLGAR
ncbi:MAG TPA: thioredoxin domain-containing protein, partial [Novosphingobium sp.]|nr:thioredoxin domain-containing protein [Novosphingobium sp.]